MIGKKKRSRRQSPRLSGLTINKIIPNAITVSATVAGLSGIRFALEGRWEFAAGAILIAAILDTLDGRMARLLNASSDFGAELDSLSDFVSFGVAPGMIMYFWSLGDLGGIGWACALFFSICMGLRLARFNSVLGTQPPYAYNYFQGVPAPAAAGLCMLPLVLTLVDPSLRDFFVAEMVAPWIIFVALLAVSSLPTFSFKKMKIPSSMVLPGLALVGLAIAMLVGRPWVTMSIVLIAYLVTIPFSVQRFAKLKAEAESLHQDGDETSSENEEGDTPSNKS
ncbi:CDP-alcohol phosphatidyltransferase family protein [Curvivirga sp.]|uniref:CDP-alcohol phosphatidyltransferase family protein n=1 Tax=Curvivirga sp. TaxID=2856848 RepID=UPI003B596F2A